MGEVAKWALIFAGIICLLICQVGIIAQRFAPLANHERITDHSVGFYSYYVTINWPGLAGLAAVGVVLFGTGLIMPRQIRGGQLPR